MNIINSKPERPVIDNTELVRAFGAGGGRILHIRPYGGRRGMTFAYRQSNSRIEVATSVAHRHDAFTKKVGTQIAINNFLDARTIFLPLSKQTRAELVATLEAVSYLLQE